MSPERLTELKTYAERQLSVDNPEAPTLLELIDALTAERERAEQAVELAEDLFDWITSGDMIGADEIKDWSERLMEVQRV